MKNSLTAGEVQMVLKKGKRIHADGVTVVYMEQCVGEQRYAIIVPKKQVKSRVMRNKIRRIIREILKDVQLPYPMAVIIYTEKTGTYSDIKKLLSGAVNIVL